MDVVPCVPLMTAGDAAFVSPYEGHSVEELIDIEFQSLRSFQIAAVKINVVSEIAEGWHHFLIRQIFGELHVPQNVGERHGAADIKLHRPAATQCG